MIGQQTSERRPVWARDAGLPTFEALSYVQTLAFAVLAVMLASYVLIRVAGDPRRAVRAARKKTGV